MTDYEDRPGPRRPAIVQRSSVWSGACLLLAVAATSPAFAVDVPFTYCSRGGVCIEGVGKLENGRFTATGTILGGIFGMVGEIRDNELTIEADGALMGGGMGPNSHCIGRGSAKPAAGKVSMLLSVTCQGSGNSKLLLNLPSDASALANTTAPPPAPAVAPSALANTAAPQPAPMVAPAASAQPALDPIDETYVAVNPAKVRERPDALSTRIRTIEAGGKITVVGKLKGQDWYLVSESDKVIGYVIANQLVPESQYHPAVASTALAAPAAVTPAPPPPPASPAIPPALANLDFGRYQALVIGNDNYANGLPGLKTAAGDAQAVAQTLKSVYGFKVILLVNATRNQIIGALAKLRQTLTLDDNLLIYYAGRGSYDQAADQGYWLPVDAMQDDPSNWVSNTAITNMLKAIQARHVMVVADSCYSGTLTREASVAIRDADYIQRMVQKKARTVMTSGGLEPVADSGGSGHSVFASAFIAALQQNNGVMDAQSFFTKMREPVVLAAPQTPEYSNLRFAGHEGGDFVFVRKP